MPAGGHVLEVVGAMIIQFVDVLVGKFGSVPDSQTCSVDVIPEKRIWRLSPLMRLPSV